MQTKKTILLLLCFIFIFSLLYAGGRQARFLEIENLLFAPNPFTPYSSFTPFEEDPGQGLRISFTVSTQTRFIWVTGKIYNTRGNLVRTLVELEPMYSRRGPGEDDDQVEIVLWWNGQTDFNRMAQNGRYIFYLRVSDSEAETFSKEKMGTFVMVK